MLLLSLTGFTFRLVQYRQAENEYAAIARSMATESAPATGTVRQDAPVIGVPSGGVAVTSAATSAPSGSAAVSSIPAAVASPAPASVAATPSPVPVFYYNDQIRSLKVANSDTVGYLEIEGTAIRYPVVKAEDNTYYETHTFSKKKNPSGAVFLDSANNPDLSDFNLVLYGHNMKDGSMFHELVQYRKATFAGQHRTIRLTGLYGEKTYAVFAAFTCSATVDVRGFGCVTAPKKQTFIKDLQARSLIDPGSVTVTPDSRLITLVTCREDVEQNYFVVQGVLVEEKP